MDAYIINFVMGYKVLDGRKCGFPESAFEKVKGTLEKYKISYKIIYKDKEPIIVDFKKNNKYLAFYNTTLNLLSRQKRIELAIKNITEADETLLDEIIKVIENAASE